MSQEIITKARLTKANWLEFLNEWKLSGESQVRFCKRKGINYCTFLYWKKKQDSNRNTQVKNSFSEARISAPMNIPLNNIRIALPNGANILIPLTINKVLLKEFLQFIGIATC